MRIPFFLLVLLLPFLSPAQYDKLLQNKDILWAAEAKVLVSFEPQTEANIPGFLEAIPVKLMQEENFNPSPSPVTQGLIELMEAGRWPAFADAGLTQPLSREAARAQMAQVDTIITFDPETYEETIEVVQWDFNPEDVGNYRLKQTLFFDPRQGKLQCRPEAVAPTIAITDEYGQLKYFQPLFYWKRE